MNCFMHFATIPVTHSSLRNRIMKLVVFGATGNVGQHVVAEALRRGHEVVGVVRDPDAVQSPDKRVKLLKGDATNADSVAKIARGADAVVTANWPRPNGPPRRT